VVSIAASEETWSTYAPTCVTRSSVRLGYDGWEIDTYTSPDADNIVSADNIVLANSGLLATDCCTRRFLRAILMALA
jgi:hypothetical protein